MKILLAGGLSSLGRVLHPVLASFAEVLTAGRGGCDIDLDMSWPAECIDLPKELDSVINLAAYFGGDDVEAILEAEEVNALGALKLAYACSRSGVGHLVQISSVFAGLGEDSPFFNSYALSKRHGEDLASLYCRMTGMPLAILRPARLYGEGEGFRRHQPFLYSLLDKAESGKEIVLFGRNDAWRNFIHAEDMAEVIARVVLRRLQGRYICADLSNVRISEIAATAVAAFGSSSSIRFEVSKPDILDDRFTADDVLYRLIDYYPRITLEQGFAREATSRRALT